MIPPNTGLILSMSGQAWLFLSTVVAGMVIGLFYDVLRTLRRVAPHKGWVVQLQDIGFWLCATVGMFYFMLGQSFGEIRMFALLGTGVGALLYFATISHLVLKVAVTVVKFVKRVIVTAVAIVTLPVRFIYNLIGPKIKNFMAKRRKNLRVVARYGKTKAKKTARNWFILRKKV